MDFLLAGGVLFLGFYVITKGRGIEKSIGAIILGFGLLLSGIVEGKTVTIFGGVLVLIGGIVWYYVYQKNEKTIKEIETKKIAKEYQEAIASQQAVEPWAIRYATEPCPHCGHYKVRCAKWEDKRLSVAFWGIASNKIDKNFKCEECNEMW